MIPHPELELHNVAELSSAGPGPGLRLQRVPEAVRLRLDPAGRGAALCPTHVELRYVSDAPEVRLTLHSEVHHEYVRVFQGDFFREEHCLVPGETRTLSLRRNSDLLARSAALRRLRREAFSPELMRVRLSGTGRVRMVCVETDGDPVRPPRPEEKPARTLLAYGSSITQGFSASRLSLPWITSLCHRLGTDYLNLGFGGSCHCEPELAAHIAEREDWQVALLELGVNMLGAQPRFTDEDFRRRAGRFIELVSARPDRRVFVITPFPAAHDLPDAARAAEPWREILRDLVASFARPNLALLEGPACLGFSGLTADLVHPDDAGHASLAHALADRLSPYFSALPGPAVAAS